MSLDKEKLLALMADKKAAMKRVEKTVKPAPGKNRIRLLPGWRAAEQHIWFHDFGQHFIKDAADQIQAVYICTHSTFGTECPVCKAMSEAGRHITDDATAEVLAKAKASKTVLVNALMLDSADPNTPVILELKPTVFGQLVDIVEEWGLVALDPEDGKEIIITRDGKGLNTRYSAQIGAKSYKVPPASLAKLNNLDEYVKQESDEQKRRAIGAVNSVAGVLGVGGDAPTTTVSRLAAPGKPVASDDDLLDLDLTEKPAAAAKSAAASQVALNSELDDLLGDLPD